MTSTKPSNTVSCILATRDEGKWRQIKIIGFGKDVKLVIIIHTRKSMSLLHELESILYWWQTLPLAGTF